MTSSPYKRKKKGKSSNDLDVSTTKIEERYPERLNGENSHNEDESSYNQSSNSSTLIFKLSEDEQTSNKKEETKEEETKEEETKEETKEDDIRSQFTEEQLGNKAPENDLRVHKLPDYKTKRNNKVASNGRLKPLPR
jgi:hypothetical protein